MANKTKLNAAPLSNADKAQSLFEKLSAVGIKAAQWHNTTYRKATDELYALLCECYSVTAEIRRANTTVVRELNQVLKNNGIPFNEGTALETRVVRVVFGDIGKRAHNYARVLIIAREQRVYEDSFVEWLDAQGGVEAVRKQRNGMTAAEVRNKRIETAEKSFETVKSKQLSDAPKRDGSDFTIALVRHNGGSKRIVGFCESVSLVKAVLANLADTAKAEAETTERSKLDADYRKLSQQLAASSTNKQRKAA